MVPIGGLGIVYGWIGEDNDGMDVIRHNHEGVQLHGREPIRQGVPHLLNHCASRIKPHPLLHHLAEQALPVLRADGDKITAGFAVVILFQPDGTAMVLLGIVGYGICTYL